MQRIRNHYLLLHALDFFHPLLSQHLFLLHLGQLLLFSQHLLLLPGHLQQGLHLEEKHKNEPDVIKNKQCFLYDKTFIVPRGTMKEDCDQ